MKSRAEFREFYEGELRGELERFEARRRGILRNFSILVIVSLAVLAAGAAVGLASGEEAAVVLTIGAAILAVIACGVGWWILTKGYRLEFKNAVVGAVARFCDPSLAYRPQSCISESAFRESRLFLTGVDRYRGEDYISGRIGETEIEFSEVHAEYKTTTRNSKGHTSTSYHTIFRGLFFIGDFHKDFQGVTVVLPDTAEKAFGWLGQKLQEWNIARSEELVKLEDPEFEHEFVVYADDQVEARYILSTALMRRIVDFQREMQRTVYVSFVNSKVFVAISMSRNLFEPRIFRTVLDFDLVREYLGEMELALGIVEDLNLNTRIWSKE